ncbi:MAG: helix-turn-helix domain-containing protein [Sphingopyxis sp.]|nr:helix-turn-helix transcriptional regulator [Sphingopyxis sp.]MBW8296292.1 helix-turn-helix domain-containing protein [Sphingopyxis sp.]
MPSALSCSLPGKLLQPARSSADEAPTAAAASQVDCLSSYVDISVTSRCLCSRGYTPSPCSNTCTLRQEKGWSQKDYADRADIHRTYVSDIERGRRNLTITIVQKLAVPFEVSASRLLD